MYLYVLLVMHVRTYVHMLYIIVQTNRAVVISLSGYPDSNIYKYLTDRDIIKLVLLAIYHKLS